MLITHIRRLLQVREDPSPFVAGSGMADLPFIENAFLRISDGLIIEYGTMDTLQTGPDDEEAIDAAGGMVLPGFVDSHTHLVFANYRESEFVDKIKGLTYAEIAARGGGILNSAKIIRETSEEQLLQSALTRAYEILSYGTVAVEIKSGYGLETEQELKMLRVARKIGELTPLTVRTTFLGAHAVPEGITKADYLDVVCEEMIPAVAEEGLAEFCDVFCEQGFFSQQESVRVLEAGKKHGLIPKVHANQLHRSGGVQAGVEVGAISVDHLECMDSEEIEVLQGGNTMPTALPGAAFFLNATFPPARQIIQAGLPLAIATDYNPGSSPMGDMALMVSMACIKMKMLPEEAINAATINTAYAMGLSASHGTISVGKKGSVIITEEIPSIAYLPYAVGRDCIRDVIVEGARIERKKG